MCVFVGGKWGVNVILNFVDELQGSGIFVRLGLVGILGRTV